MNLALKEDKDILDRDTIPLMLEQEFQIPSLVMKNELAKEEKLPWEERQVEEQHMWKTIDNVLVVIDKFNFPVDFLTFGMEVNQQVFERPSITKSQVWIDTQHGEMTFLAGKEKMKFDLHQNTPITDEQKMTCMWIKSSFLPFEEPTPDILQEDTLERYKFEGNSFPTKELAFELTPSIMEVEELILTSDGDDGGALDKMDKGRK